MKEQRKPRSYSEVENEKLRAVVRSLLDRPETKTQMKLAERIGVKQPVLSGFLLGRYGAGPHMARGVAREAGTTVEALLGQDPRDGVSDDYGNRQVVVDCAYRLGFSARAIARLRGLKLGAGADDPPPLSWLRTLLRLEDEQHDPVMGPGARPSTTRK